MSDSAHPAYSVAANLRWFAVVYFAVSAALSAALIVALYVLPNFAPPTAGLSIGIYVGVVYAAGLRFKQKTDTQWTSRDRNWLAPGYAGVSFIVSLLIIGFAFPFDPGTRDMAALVMSDGATAIAIAIPTIWFVFWAVARCSLAVVARQRGKQQ